MSFKRYDVITFEENDKVVVLESLLHEGGEYLYVDEIYLTPTLLFEG